MPVRKSVPRKADNHDLSPAEKLYVSGAPYETPLPYGANKFEWLELHCGGPVISPERREYLDGLKDAKSKNNR